jgi:predicted membrane channel-forming protein YqfA (hemolysin III family)
MDIPMRLAPSAGGAAEDIPMAGFVSLTLASAAVGILLALALARYVTRPARTFVVVSGVLTVVSFAGPITAHQATTATRVVLGLTHVVAAAVILPAVASRLPQRRTRR